MGTGSARDTVQLANIDNDNSRGTTLPLVITREESLAIAAAIQKRRQPTTAAPRAATSPATSASQGNAGQGGFAQGAAQEAGAAARGAGETRVFISSQSGPVQVDRETLRREIQRVFTDSFAMAFARVDSTLANLPRMVRMDGAMPRVATTAITPLIGPPDDGTVRVVVSPFSPRSGIPEELSRFGIDMADALRGALSRVEKVDVTSPELTERAMRGAGDRMVAGWRLRADYLVTGAYSVRADSVRIIVQFTDVRTGRFTRAEQISIPITDTRRGMETSTARVLAWMDTARTMPGRHGPSRGGTFVPGGQGGIRPPNPAPPPER
jgi:TolB-like protein